MLGIAGGRRVPRWHTLPTTIRVGVDHSPPFYSIQPDGSVRGLAVDVLNEVARRREIRLIWVPLHDIPLDSALDQRLVQLWPLVGTTEERREKFYLSKPWLESDYILVSLQKQPIRNSDDAAGKVIAHARLKFTKIVMDRHLARSRELVRVYRAEAIQAVCRGDAAAALVESRVLDGILLTRPEGCEMAHFHISTLTGATSPLSIAAVPEVRETAAALRDGIGELRRNGFLSAKLDEWSPFSAEGTRSIWAEEEANKRSNVYGYCLIIIGILSSGLMWLTWRAWQLKRKAESSDAGLREAQRRFSAFMEHSPAMAFMKDPEGRLLYVNRAWSEAVNFQPAEAIGKDDFALWPDTVARDLRAVDLRILQEDKPLQVIERIPVSRGDVRDFLVVKFPFANEKGERFIGGTAIDITEREVVLCRLAESEARYRELFEQNPLPALVYDVNTMAFLAVNDAAVSRYGWTRAHFLNGMTLPKILAPGEPPGYRSGAWRHQTKDGLQLTVDVTGYELEYEKRQARLMIVRDLTEQERMLDQLRISEERWQLALRGAGDALWDWDLVTGRVFRSPRWNTMLGYGEAEIGDTIDDFHRLLHPDDSAAIRNAVQDHLEKRTFTYSAEYRMRHKDGTWLWIMGRGQAVWDERGRALRMAGSHTDITERRRTEDLLSLQARTDALTGLANRREFERHFEGIVRAAREGGTDLTVCVCDLDCFKQVNDTYGHAAGDNVLGAFAGILRDHLRKADLPARMGGDEFIVALPKTASPEAAEIMERIREELSARAFEAPAGRFHVSSSFGVAELSASHADGDALIAEADRSLYEAKDAGRNRTLVAA
jgi:diguanylate cyclase (GGDEF)-like protein/PAS domain S-box-containing protein